jgi:hypothetical protein
MYPNEQLPSHFKQEFNIAYALHRICVEILKLQLKE